MQALEDTSKPRIPWLCHGPVVEQDPGISLFSSHFQDFCEQEPRAPVPGGVGTPQQGAAPGEEGTGNTMYTMTHAHPSAYVQPKCLKRRLTEDLQETH